MFLFCRSERNEWFTSLWDPGHFPHHDKRQTVLFNHAKLAKGHVYFDSRFLHLPKKEAWLQATCEFDCIYMNTTRHLKSLFSKACTIQCKTRLSRRTPATYIPVDLFMRWAASFSKIFVTRWGGGVTRKLEKKGNKFSWLPKMGKLGNWETRFIFSPACSQKSWQGWLDLPAVQVSRLPLSCLYWGKVCCPMIKPISAHTRAFDFQGFQLSGFHISNFPGFQCSSCRFSRLQTFWNCQLSKFPGCSGNTWKAGWSLWVWQSFHVYRFLTFWTFQVSDVWGCQCYSFLTVKVLRFMN